MKKELMKVNGGLENNTELGNKVNLILIDSIKGNFINNINVLKKIQNLIQIE